MSSHQVIACFVFYSNEQIVFQGTFQVSESRNTVTFPSTDGCEFIFSHSYGGATCDIRVSRHSNGSITDSCQLTIPINRTKIKWKQINLGTQYEVFYRCAFENGESKSMTKQRRKSQAKKAARGSSQICIPIYYTGEASGNENHPDVA